MKGLCSEASFPLVLEMINYEVINRCKAKYEGGSRMKISSRNRKGSFIHSVNSYL